MEIDGTTEEKQIAQNTHDKSIVNNRREFIILSVVSAVAAFIPGCKDKKPLKKGMCTESADSKTIIKISENMLAPSGKVVYVSPEKNQKYTVISVKMIHPSKSFPQLNNDVLKHFNEIMTVYNKLHEMGVTFFGGEGFDIGEVDKNIIRKKGLSGSKYPFIRFEENKDDKVCSFGVDDAELLEQTHNLLKQNRPLDALRLNPERTRAMAAYIKYYFEDGRMNTICITVGADHLQTLHPELIQIGGKENLIDLLEEAGIKVVVVETPGFQMLNEKISQLK